MRDKRRGGERNKLGERETGEYGERKKTKKESGNSPGHAECVAPLGSVQVSDSGKKISSNPPL